MTDAEKQTLRSNRGELESALKDAGCDFMRGNIARCPWHDDKHPSGSIYLAPGGAWKFACHKCKICEDVIGVKTRGKGTSPGEVLKSLTTLEAPRNSRRYESLAALRDSVYGAEAEYTYVDPITKRIDLVIFRQRLPDGGKKFIQFRPVGEGSFESGAPPKPWPIYGRSRLAKAEWAFVVEGEKCVHALADIGVVATTSPCGAGKASSADWSPLAGKKVYLWPDNDDVGRQHMAAVAEILGRLSPPAEVLLVNPADFDLPEKGDVVDFLDNYQDLTKAERAETLKVVRDLATAPNGPAGELSGLIEDMISGKFASLDWPYRITTKVSQSLLPGTVVCICGDPACGKSFMVLESAMHWHENQIKVALYELEDDRSYHLQRALAQKANISDLTDATWVKEHPEESRAAFARHNRFLDSFGRCIFDAPDQPPRVEEIADWVDRRAAEKCRIIVIDPITAAQCDDKPWISDQRFMMRVKATARKSGSTIVLVTHPRMGKHGKPLDGMAGGASYPRFAQTVFWIERHEKLQRANYTFPTMPGYSGVMNRSLRIAKARNGRGTGLELGFDFDHQSLRFVEQGIVVSREDA